MALDGLEVVVKASHPGRIQGIRPKINVIRYADDFIITANSKELLENKVKPAVISFLEERGLSLSEEKTKITRINHGFNFLGQNVRKYNGKLLVKPSRDNVKSFLQHIRETIRKHRGSKTVALIHDLNSKVRGWANYHKHVVSGRIFNYVDDQIRMDLWRRMERRHRNKNTDWLYKKYLSKGPRPGRFSTVVKNKKKKTSKTYELIRAVLIDLAFEMLEPCDGKLSSTVLRGERSCKASDLPDLKKDSMESSNKIISTNFNAKDQASKNWFLHRYNRDFGLFTCVGPVFSALYI